MIRAKIISLVLFIFGGFNLCAQRCDEFDQALATFNTYLKNVRNADGSISLTPAFQRHNLAVIFACDHCLSLSDQANNIKNRLVFTYTLGLHYYYDSKFQLSIEELKDCLKNPKNKDLLPNKQITYADASSELIREMSYPRHGSGTFTVYYNGKAGLIPELLVEHGMEDSSTKYRLWSEDQLLNFSKLAYRISDSTKAINNYKTLFNDVTVKFNNPVLTVVHTYRHAVDEDTGNHMLMSPDRDNSHLAQNNPGRIPENDSVKIAILRKYPLIAQQIDNANKEQALLKKQSEELQKKLSVVQNLRDSICNVLNKITEVQNSEYLFYNDDDFGIVTKRKSLPTGVMNQAAIQQSLPVNDRANTPGNDEQDFLSNMPNPIYEQTTPHNPKPGIGTTGDLFLNGGTSYSDFFNFLGLYFNRKYSDSLILTIHVIDAPYDTSAGRQYYISTVQSLHLPGPKGSLGYFNPIANAIVFWKPSGEGTLTHELTHAYLSNAFQNCPLWLNEGIASLFEEFSSTSGNDFIPKDNWRLIYISEYNKLKSHQLPLPIIFSDTTNDGVVNDMLKKCYARYFCVYLKEKKVLPQALQFINDNPGSNYIRKISDLLNFNSADDLQNDWEQWLGAKGYGLQNRFNNKDYIQSVDKILADL